MQVWNGGAGWEQLGQEGTRQERQTTGGGGFGEDFCPLEGRGGGRVKKIRMGMRMRSHQQTRVMTVAGKIRVKRRREGSRGIRERGVGGGSASWYPQLGQDQV